MKLTGLIASSAIALCAMSGTTHAADLANNQGQSCGGFTGLWHFVNNQTGLDAPRGTLHATFSSGDSCTVSARKVLKRTQHFYCTGAGTLLSASTDLNGRLVLSDYECSTKKIITK